MIKVRRDDAVCGLLYIVNAVLFSFFSIKWMCLDFEVLQIISPFTKFCPVSFILNIMMPDTQSIQNAK